MLIRQETRRLQIKSNVSKLQAGIVKNVEFVGDRLYNLFTFIVFFLDLEFKFYSYILFGA